MPWRMEDGADREVAKVREPVSLASKVFVTEDQGDGNASGDGQLKNTDLRWVL